LQSRLLITVAMWQLTSLFYFILGVSP
jgi:hypothetical protein